MGHFTATTLGVLEAACMLVLAVAIICVIAARTRRARHCDASRRRRDELLDALRHARRGLLLSACEEARTSQSVREDVRAIAGGLALAPQRVLLVEAARDAGLDDALRASLTSSDTSERLRAVSLLGLLRLASSPLLEPLLVDADAEVRLASARAIAMLDTSEGARALMSALVEGAIDPDRLVEQLARPSAVPELVRAFGESELAPARSRLAEALGLTRSPAGIAPLASLLRAGIEEERVRACHALGRIGAPEVVPLLVEALADDAWAVRAEAAKGLTGCGDASCVAELERALSDGAWWVRANAAAALRAIGPPGVAALVRASRSGDRITAAPAREALALEHALDGPDDEGLGLAA
jgi:HEAT repeat protein